MVLNPKINDLAPETALFVHFHDPGTFWGLNQGGGGMLDLEFFKKMRKKCSKIHFYQMLITFPLFFLILAHTGGGWGELILRGGGMSDWYFFKFCLKIHFDQILITFPLFIFSPLT